MPNASGNNSMTLEISTQRRTSMAVRRWEILLVRARATRNLKLEPECALDHSCKFLSTKWSKQIFLIQSCWRV